MILTKQNLIEKYNEHEQIQSKKLAHLPEGLSSKSCYTDDLKFGFLSGW